MESLLKLLLGQGKTLVDYVEFSCNNSGVSVSIYLTYIQCLISLVVAGLFGILQICKTFLISESVDGIDKSFELMLGLACMSFILTNIIR